MQFPVHIELRRSHRLFLLLSLMHGVAAVSICFLPWALPVSAPFLLLVGVSLWRALRPSPIHALFLTVGKGMACRLENGERVAATIQPDSTVFVRLVVLRLRLGEAGRIVSLTLFPDQMSADEFRRLRMWLRWNLARAAPSDDGEAS